MKFKLSANSLSITLCLSSILMALGLVEFPASAASNVQVGDKHSEYRMGREFNPERFLTGGWGGYRQKLIDKGILFSAKYYATVLGNPAGGEEKGIRYAGLLNVYLDFDLERLLGLNNSKLVVSGAWASGRSLSDEDIGNFFTASEVFSGRGVRLYQLFLMSEFMDGALNVSLGRMAIADEFASSPIFYNYVNTAIDGHPISLSINDQAFFSDPQSSLGARARWNPDDSFYVMAGVYNSNPIVADNDNRGLDFSLSKGVILISEAAYLLNPPGSGELEGVYKLGSFYDTGRFDKLSREDESVRGNYGLYMILQQMIYRENTESDQGLSPWAAVTVSPDETINTFPYFISGGLVYQGLFNGRDKDVSSFGFAWGGISDDLPGLDYELMLEITHMFQTTGWMQIQPDFQWIVHPGGSSDIPNAIVLGLQLAVDI